ncbi:unnamed protein product [Angiostrongylus costaricensis]|uniref:Uncharacterized protein n=1 Tax=Angiostrongylus costaricensis TaxID=334426 RepID=A0A0R3PJX2_ANGCS|nr:unnamed protein product [Angiostrongylus costaricensis]
MDGPHRCTCSRGRSDGQADRNGQTYATRRTRPRRPSGGNLSAAAARPRRGRERFAAARVPLIVIIYPSLFCALCAVRARHALSPQRTSSIARHMSDRQHSLVGRQPSRRSRPEESTPQTFPGKQ